MKEARPDEIRRYDRALAEVDDAARHLKALPDQGEEGLAEVLRGLLYFSVALWVLLLRWRSSDNTTSMFPC